MATAKDVAQYILEKSGRMSTIKLQKLVYYCQAWTLVWDDEPLFDDPIEAWANGPVVPNLFWAHQGEFSVANVQGNVDNLTRIQKENIDIVLRDYGSESPQYLVELTHMEAPWKDARGNTRPGARCNNIISHAAMAEYYSGLLG